MNPAKMKPKSILLKLVLFSSSVFCNHLLAQSGTQNYFMPTIFPNAPNTAAFSKYGNYEVSLFTGVPDISVPIYTIEAGDLKMPITLSYHASGIKVSDVASWAGLGWSINTGGSIIRSIVGMPDETGYLTGELPNHNLNPQVNADLDELYNIVGQGTDVRPDIFSYNIPGHCGKFFFNGTNNYQVQKIPFSPISIQKSININNKNALSFTIKDEHGTTFLLGQNYVETTGVSGGGAISNYTATSAWMLENMISSNKRDTIRLSYSSVAINQPDALNETCRITDRPVSLNPFCNIINIGSPVYVVVNNSPGIIEQQLKTIYFKNGRIDFDLNTTPRADIGGGSVYGGTNFYSIGQIRVSIYNFARKTFEVQKTIKFYQSYFGSSSLFGTTGVGNLRLRLDSIQILDKAASIIQHYRFRYNRIPLPNYTSLSRDFWGYYNHKQDGYNANGSPSATLIPQMIVDDEPGTGTYTPPLPTITIGSTIANSRGVDTNFMQACMLDTIYYPTGGYSTFSYQTNRYVDNSGKTQFVGGLRVASINSYDGINPTPIIKTYQYGSGQPTFVPSTVEPSSGFYTGSVTYRTWICADSACFAKVRCAEIRLRTFYAQSTASLDPFDDSLVGYPSVTEFYGTPASNTGKTSYSYSFASDNIQMASSSGNMIYLSNSFQRGLLLSRAEYLRQANGSYQILKLDSNAYSFTKSGFTPTVYHGVGLAVGQTIINTGAVVRAYHGQVGPDDSQGTFLFGTYDIQTGSNYLVSSTSKIYDTQNTSLYSSSTVNYIYGDTTHWQVAKISHVDSKGNTHVTVNKYPFDYLSGSTTHNALLDTMINHNMISEIVEKWDSVKDVAASTNFISGAQFNTYQTGSLPGSIVPWKISTLAVSSPITNFSPMYVNTGTGALTPDSRYVQRISFDAYDSQNNIAQYTPRNATTSVILWDYLSENPIAQVKNIPSGATSTAYTSFEANGKGNWIFSGTPVSDLTAPTGKMVYPLSSGSITYNYSPLTSYVLSYWSNNGAATVTLNSGTITGNNLSTSGNWTYYEHIVPATAGTITISGSTSIDELRLYPVNAQMITYAYEPEGLMTMADTKGGINHFEYDYFARLKNIKDFYGNIVNNYGYHTYDQTIGNQAYSSSFTRNNCPTGTTPGSLTYVVPANKYYSSTLASANAEATYDLNTNGQAKANQNCGCPITTTSFTLSNSTGINGFQVTFSGISSPYNFPATGSTVIQVPVGTYATIKAGPFGSATHTFSLTGQSTQSNVHYATFTNVAVTSGSNLTLSIQ